MVKRWTPEEIRTNRPKFSREHHEALAEALGKAGAITPKGSMARGAIVALGCVADMLEADNPNFDKARFLQAALRQQEISLAIPRED